MGRDRGFQVASDFFSVSDAQVSQIARELQDPGVTTLRGVLTRSWVDTARDEIAAYVQRHGPGDYNLMDTDDWECPAIRGFAENPEMEALLRTLSSAPWYWNADPGSYTRRVLRIHDGTGETSNPYVWHFDDNTLTVHVPLVIPGGGAGHFGALPAQRRLRRTMLTTIRERIRNDEFPHPGTTERFTKASDRYTVPLIPGEAVMFVGHRTLHSALPWPAGEVRANLLLHYGHAERPQSGSLRALRALRNGVAASRKREANAVVEA